MKLLKIVAMAASFLIMVQSGFSQGTDNPGAVSGTSLEQAENEGIFAPFPSRIRVAVKGIQVIITWEDSSDVEGSYAVYRHTDPLDSSSFVFAQLLGLVEKGKQSFIDVPFDSQPYYYAVLGSNTESKPYEVFIPLKNTTISPLIVEAANTSNTITSISALRKEERVVIAFQSLRSGGRYVLYRHTDPIISLPKLLEATTVASFEDSGGSFVDYPVPGIAYFYALIDENSLRAGKITLEPGANITTKSIMLPAGGFRTGLPEAASFSRAAPLPFLSLNREVAQGGSAISPGLELPPRRILSVETEKTVRELLLRTNPTKLTEPSLALFEDDLKPAMGGEDYTLKLIVSNKLSKGLYEEAADQLVRFLSISRSPEIAARAHFYRGQALAFSGNLKDAFFEFLLSQERYYVEANIWIDYILEKSRNSTILKNGSLQ